MVKLEYFTEEDFQQLIDWIPNAEFSLQWVDLLLHFH